MFSRYKQMSVAAYFQIGPTYEPKTPQDAPRLLILTIIYIVSVKKSEYNIFNMFIIMQLLRRSKDTVWSPVTDHYVNKVIFFNVNSKCQYCFYVADKCIISSND